MEQTFGRLSLKTKQSLNHYRIGVHMLRLAASVALPAVCVGNDGIEDQIGNRRVDLRRT